MKLNQLTHACQALERFGVNATGITIHGKTSMTISFTVPRTELDVLDLLCVNEPYTYRTSADYFLPSSKIRIQLTPTRRRRK